jgi:SRSO17 transposase
LSKRSEHRLCEAPVYRQCRQKEEWYCRRYGIWTIPEDGVALAFEVYKPREHLKPGDEYHSKPQIVATMIRYLQRLGFHLDLVLADSLYGEAKTTFVNVLDELKLP